MGGDGTAGRPATGKGGDVPAALTARLDRLDATAGEILAVVRGILAVVAAEPDDGRPRLDELLAEIVALQRDTLRVAGENAAALRRLCAALLPQATGGAVAAPPNGHAPTPGHGRR